MVFATDSAAIFDLLGDSSNLRQFMPNDSLVRMKRSDVCLLEVQSQTHTHVFHFENGNSNSTADSEGPDSDVAKTFCGGGPFRDMLALSIP